HGHLGGLRTLEDAIDVTGGLAELINDVRRGRDQPSSGNGVAITIDSGQLLAGRNCDDHIAINRRGRGLGRGETTLQGGGKGCDTAFDLAGVTNVERAYQEAE